VQTSFRPALESLEAREVLSSPATLTPPPAAAALAAPAQASVTQSILNLLDLKFTGVSVQNGTLVASGTVAGQPFTAPLTLTTSPNPDPAACPILHVALGPLNLNLLGLQVNLDDCNGGPVTVDITAQHGPGDLLGNLLCNVSDLLNQGTPLGTILGSLTGTQLTQLTGGLTSVLNGVLGGLPSQGTSTGSDGHHSAGGSCDVLNLEVPGGVHLDVLGLKVDTSAVCLDVSAQRGPGNLLGNLVCGVAGLLDNGVNTHALDNALMRLDTFIHRLL